MVSGKVIIICLILCVVSALGGFLVGTTVQHEQVRATTHNEACKLCADTMPVNAPCTIICKQ